MVSFFIRALHPRSSEEDTARREFILNVFIAGALALLLVGIGIDAVHYVVAEPLAYQENSLPSFVLYTLAGFLVGLYIVSRRYSVLVASYALITTLFLLAAYMGYAWGVDVPAQIVFYPLVIVMAGILLSTRIAMTVAFLCITVMAITAFLHYTGVVVPSRYWKEEVWIWGDIVMMGLIYFIVAVAAWLSNREMEKSLVRARRSEAALAKERDTLEERVAERTAALHALQVERMADTYRLVEFGRVASGMVHDLMSPLTALSLNINRIADEPESVLSEDVLRAQRAAEHMHKRLEMMRKHLARTGTKERCMACELLKETVDVLSSYARARNVTLVLDVPEPLSWHGDPAGFSQIVTNLISNAVQSYPEKVDGESSTVEIRAVREGDDIVLRVADTGSGIPPDMLTRIFEPFVTTKPAALGMGLGLSLVKRIVEKEFGGRVHVDSVLGRGTTFVVYLPIREP